MAGRYDLVINQGESFYFPFWWRPGGVLLDLSTYTAVMKIRADVDDPTPVITLTTENSRIALAAGDATTPNIELTIDAADTAALPDWGTGVYNLKIVSAGGSTKWVLEGHAILSKDVSR